MSKVLIEEQTLYDIGDAIREKNGEETTYKPGEMGDAIKVIDTAKLLPLTVSEYGPYTPPEGYNGFSSVFVTMASSISEYVAGIIPILSPTNMQGYTVSASSYYSSSFNPIYAFDNAPTNSLMTNGWLADGNDTTPWIACEFPDPIQANTLAISTSNNGASATRDVFVEYLNSEGSWINALAGGADHTTLSFIQGTYGSTSTMHVIKLIPDSYYGIRVRGEERFFMGSNQTACTFNFIQLYANSHILNSCLYGYDVPSNDDVAYDGAIYFKVTDQLSVEGVYTFNNGAWSLVQ